MIRCLEDVLRVIPKGIRQNTTIQYNFTVIYLCIYEKYNKNRHSYINHQSSVQYEEYLTFYCNQLDYCATSKSQKVCAHLQKKTVIRKKRFRNYIQFEQLLQNEYLG